MVDSGYQGLKQKGELVAVVGDRVGLSRSGLKSCFGNFQPSFPSGSAVMDILAKYVWLISTAYKSIAVVIGYKG